MPDAHASLLHHNKHKHTDVKDILGVPRGSAVDERKPEVKAKPEKMKRPEGMSREAFALLGGSNPVIPTHLLGEARRPAAATDADR